MKQLFLSVWVALLLTACGTHTITESTTSLSYWNLDGNVKTVKQRQYIATPENDVIEKKYMYDSDNFQLNNIYFSFNPDIHINPYLVDVTFNEKKQATSVIFNNIMGRAKIREKMGAMLIFGYDSNGLLTNKILFDANGNEAITASYTYKDGNCYIKRIHKDDADFEYEELLLHTTDEIATSVEIYKNEKLAYTVDNVIEKGACVKSILRNAKGKVCMTVDSERNKKGKATKRVTKVIDPGTNKENIDLEQFTYNKEGKPLFIELSLYKNGENNISYTYNKEGDYTQIDIEKENQQFTYEYEYDTQGNWTKVVRKRETKKEKPLYMIIERDITYFD